MIEKEFNDRIYTKSTAKREKYTIFMLQNIGLFPLLDSATHVDAKKEVVSKCWHNLFYAQSPDFPKPGLCYYPKFM